MTGAITQRVPVVTDEEALRVAILLLGIGRPPLQTPGASLVLTPDDNGLAALHAAVAGPLAAGTPTVALFPTWASPAQTRTLRTLRASLDTSDLVPVSVDLPPLALAVAAGLVAEATRGLDAGSAVAAVGPIVRSIRSVGWLGSLRGLAAVPVPLLLHARSLLPGSAFTVAPHVSPPITPVSKRHRRIPLPGPEAGTAVVAAADERGDTGAVRDALAAAGWTNPSWVPSFPAARAWWGTDHHVEVVVHPHGERLRSLAWDVPAGATCRWCGRRTSVTPCVFCRHATPVGAQS